MEEIKLNQLLHRGSQIRTQVQDSRDWIVNTIVNLYDVTDEIEIVFDDRYANELILVGDAIKITYKENEWEYIIDAWITGIKLDMVKVLTLKVASIKRINNLRKDERYSVNYGAMLYGINADEGTFGVVTNISISGLAFVTRENFVVGELVRISILLPSNSFVIDAEIVRSTTSGKGMEYGVRFVRDSEQAMDEIIALINELKEREDRLSRIVGFNL